MTVEARAVLKRGMLAANLFRFGLGMALQTDLLRFHNQKMFVVTGMGIMACTALPLHHGLMGASTLFIHGRMAGLAELFWLAWIQECSLDIRLVTSCAFPLHHGRVTFGLQETRGV